MQRSPFLIQLSCSGYIVERKGDFTGNALPKTVEDYLSWIEKELVFTEKRNKRIAESRL